MARQGLMDDAGYDFEPTIIRGGRMTINEAMYYVEDINKTVSWDDEQKQDEEFFNSVADMLEELKELRGELQKYTEAGYCDGFEDGYDKAIDDCKGVVYNGTLHQMGRMIASGEIPKEVYDKYLSNTPIGFMTPIEICRQIIAEQLKAGGENDN